MGVGNVGPQLSALARALVVSRSKVFRHRIVTASAVGTSWPMALSRLPARGCQHLPVEGWWVPLAGGEEGSSLSRCSSRPRECFASSASARSQLKSSSLHIRAQPVIQKKTNVGRVADKGVGGEGGGGGTLTAGRGPGELFVAHIASWHCRQCANLRRPTRFISMSSGIMGLCWSWPTFWPRRTQSSTLWTRATHGRRSI